jgi:TRAP-type transport system periplasmic protein
MSFSISRRQILQMASAATLTSTVGLVSAQNPVVMKVASATVNDVIHQWMKNFKSAVESRAAGRIRVELYPASQLGAIPRMVEGAAMGTIECFVTASSFLTSLDTRFQIFDMPGMIQNSAHANKLFALPETRNMTFSFGAIRGLQSISVFYHSPQHVVSRKPIRKLDDFNGMKIRVLSTPLQLQPFRKLGAGPVTMPLSEVIPALQNGAIDGFVAASTLFSALKVYDAAKFQTQLPQWPVISVAACNKAWLDKLPDDLRQIVLEEASKVEVPTNEFGAADIVRARDVWTQNKGELVALSAQESDSFTKIVTDSATEVIKGNAAAVGVFDKFAALCQQTRA